MDRGAWWARVHWITKELDVTERLNNNDQIESETTKNISRSTNKTDKNLDNGVGNQPMESYRWPMTHLFELTRLPLGM